MEIKYWLGKGKRAQSAIEFIMLITIMFFIFVGAFAIASAKITSARELEQKQTAEKLANMALAEIHTALSVSDGYARTMELPRSIGGRNYTIEVIDDRELIVNYLGYEYISFLPESIIGNLYPGENNISKQNGIVHLN